MNHLEAGCRNCAPRCTPAFTRANSSLPPGTDAPGGDGPAVARDRPDEPDAIVVGARALAAQLDDQPADVLLRGDPPEEQLALDVALGRHAEMILVRLAIVVDAEPPGSGALEFAQSPDERDFVVLVALDGAELHEFEVNRRAGFGVDDRALDGVRLLESDPQVGPLSLSSRKGRRLGSK